MKEKKYTHNREIFMELARKDSCFDVFFYMFFITFRIRVLLSPEKKIIAQNKNQITTFILLEITN